MEVEYNNLSNYLNTVKSSILEHYINQLSSNGYSTDNITIKVNIDNNDFQLVLNLNDYWKWIENGRKAGKMPPVNAILEWINKKNIKPNKKELSKKSMAFLIARKIGLKGIKGKGLLKKTEDTYREDFITGCSKAITKDISMTLKTK